MAIKIAVFNGTTKKGEVTLSAHEAKAMQRQLNGETVDEKLADLVTRITERFGMQRKIGTHLWDYHLERTGWTHEDAVNKGFDALEAAPDAPEE